MNWDYIAGFFDGEGSISFSYQNGRLKNVLLSITQCEISVLKEIQDFFGEGKISTNHHRGNKNWKPHWKPSFHYRLSKQSAILRFLHGLEDKVIVKRDKVKTSIDCLEQMKSERQSRKKKLEARMKTIQQMRGQKNSWKEIGAAIGLTTEYARYFYRSRR